MYEADCTYVDDKYFDNRDYDYDTDADTDNDTGDDTDDDISTHITVRSGYPAGHPAGYTEKPTLRVHPGGRLLDPGGRLPGFRALSPPVPRAPGFWLSARRLGRASVLGPGRLDNLITKSYQISYCLIKLTVTPPYPPHGGYPRLGHWGNFNQIH